MENKDELEKTGIKEINKVGRGNPPKEYRWKKGQSGNPSGRPKNTLKDYVRQKFNTMTLEEKEEYLKDVPKELQWRMGEGNPHQTSDNTTEITIPKPILNNILEDVHSNNSNKEDSETQEED